MFEVANTLIEEKLRADWIDTLIDWDNVEFNPVRGVAFIRLQTEWVGTLSISVGGRDRGAGYVNVSIFVPANTGTESATVMADQIAAIFNKWESGGLRFNVAKTRRIGQQEQWYRLDVEIPFAYDECN